MEHLPISQSSSGSVRSGNSSCTRHSSTHIVYAPAACPFSGVAVDPAMWESFRASLAGNPHHGQPLQPHSIPSVVSTAAFDATNEEAPRLFRHANKASNSIRVRVMNQDTKRVKDLVLNRADNADDSLFMAIYDNPAVKEAHIRKWGSNMAQSVKRGLAEVKVRMIVCGDGLTDQLLTVEELKLITKKDLFARVGESQRTDAFVEFHLVCVTKGEARSEAGPIVVSSTTVVSTPLAPPGSVIETQSTVSPLAAIAIPDPPSEVPNGSSPFATPRRNHLVHKLDSCDSAVGTQSNGDKVTERPIHQSSSAYAKLPPSPSSSVASRCAPDIVASRTPSGASSHFDSTLSDGCNLSQTTMDLDLLLEAQNMDDEQTHHLEHPLAPMNSKDKLKSTLGVSVINQTTKRCKDLVVDINDTATIFDAVYNHEAVKAAHVRKWSGPIAKAVKDGTSEIKLSVWDDDTGKPWRVFSVEEIKFTTTRQLYELVSESSNVIKILLHCVPVNDDYSTSVAINAATITDNQMESRPRIAKVKPSASMQQGSLTLEKHGRPKFALAGSSDSSAGYSSATSITSKPAAKKKATRPNHMKLSSSSGIYASCPTDMLGLITRKSAIKWSERSLNEHYRPEFMEEPSTLSVALERRLTDKSQHNLLHTSGQKGKPNATWEARMQHSASHTSVRTRMGRRATSLDAAPCPVRELDPAQTSFKRLQSHPSREKSYASDDEETRKKKLKQYMRLIRGKKPPEFQSQRALATMYNDSEVTKEPQKAVMPPVTSVVPMNERPDNLPDSVSSLSFSFQDRRPSLIAGGPNATFTATFRESGDRINRVLPLEPSLQAECGRVTGKTPETSDRITRFLALQNEGIVPAHGTRRDPSVNSSRSNQKRMESRLSADAEKTSIADSDTPPIKEISVIANSDGALPIPTTPTGVSLSADLVKDIFPYHVALDHDFRITQVGNSLEMFIQESSLVGRSIHDILTVTSPVPMHGNWDWSILEKMKDKTMFLETVPSPAMDEQVRLKGAMVEVSKSPKQVILVLFPNVKNLAELEEANLSMADLPLHSCQRDAVLLGEHSKSEVKLTSHLDKLHRDLIDSMEQQIKDRTEELAEANSDLERANAQLAIQSARQLEHFACMSHEIRTPLNCIVGMSSLLLEDADDLDPMFADSIKMINTSGDLLKAVVDDVLDYAKLESGSFEVDIKEIDLQHTLSSVVHSISQKVQEKNVRLRMHYSPLLPMTLQTDSRRLQQVLFNLLGNAGKFSKENSVIDFEVSVIPVASTDVNPEETSNGEVVRFSVKDYGKGIEEKDFKTIFDPFSQASKETQTIYGGTGLGLSITSKLVKRLGGTIGVKSEYGKFAEFTVDLPFRGKPVNTAKLRLRLQKTTIVIVERKKQYDYEVSTDISKKEPILFHEAGSEAFDLSVIRCDSMDSLFETLSNSSLVTPDKHFALLIQEDLYQFQMIERLKNLECKLNYTLMTFGPKYAVEMTKDRHLRSLEGVFPSILMETIADYVECNKRESMLSNRTSTKLNTTKFEAPLSDSMRQSFPCDSNLASFDSATKTTNTELQGSVDGGTSLSSADKWDRPSLASNLPSPGLFATVSTTSTSTNLPLAPGGLFSSVKDAPALAQGIPIPVATDNDHRVSSDSRPCSGKLCGAFNSTSTQLEAQRGSQAVIPHKSIVPQVQSCESSKEGLGRQHQKPSTPDRNMKVLYAEDNLVNQKVLSRVLNRIGISNVTIVSNGKLAVDICETEKYDCIFMDIQMPVMGGMEATKLIVERDPEAKVVFVTAHALDEFKAQADAVGATSFISKPFRLEEITNLLTELGF